MYNKWTALCFEASIAAEMMGRGATIITLGNQSHHAPYFLGFFDLAVGIERSCKLAIVVNYALCHYGNFPKSSEYRKHGHDLRRLLTAIEEIANRLNLTEQLPSTPVHKAIVDILSAFAKNDTRYYNLEFLNNNVDEKAMKEPVDRWRKEVVAAVIAKHRTSAQLARGIEAGRDTALFAGTEAAKVAFANHAIHRSETDFAARYVRMYVLQFARFLGQLLASLAHEARTQMQTPIPDFSEFFAIFIGSDDRAFRRRKAWSIYRS